MLRHVAVIDIGKTNAKVALVDVREQRETAVRKTPNSARPDGRYPHHDTGRLWEFILAGLTELNREQKVDAISVTTHGATAALVGGDGELALPVLDYEHDGPDETAAAYEAVRPLFAETGTPRLPIGLNLGAQLFWQARRFPDAFGQAAAILMYPQYWSFRLSGAMAGEVTSLGCHTDLWNPAAGDYSSLVGRMGWRRLMPALRLAGDRLGPLLPDIAARTGIAPGTPVHCGIHDSNASLLPHLLARKPPFAVVSTGTWVVCMAVGGKAGALDPARDTLVNVNAHGGAVPSARFMGGREFEAITGGVDAAWTDADVARVVAKELVLLPSVQPGSGPFPSHPAHWLPGEPASAGERYVAASFYLALMTGTCLGLAGADGPTIVEGPFARNELFLRMLGVATGRPVLANINATGTSIGAAMLATDDPPVATARAVEPGAVDGWAGYASAWNRRNAERGA